MAAPRTRGSSSRSSTDPRCRPATSTRPGWTVCTSVGRSCPSGTPTSRCCRPPSSSPGRRRRPIGRASTRSHGAAGRRPPPVWAAPWSCATGARPTASRSRRSARTGIASPSTVRPSRPRCTGSASTSAASRSVAASTGRSRRSRAPTCSSRWMAFRIEFRATTAGSSATSRPRSWSRSPSSPATRCSRAMWWPWWRA
jgi:hypothetical protein